MELGSKECCLGNRSCTFFSFFFFFFAVVMAIVFEV